MALSELAVEPTNKAVEAPVTVDLQVEIAREIEVFHLDCEQINVSDQLGRTVHHFFVHFVDEGFSHDHPLHAAHVNPVHIIPVADLVLLVSHIVNSR
jgi:hypothetical protein